MSTPEQEEPCVFCEIIARRSPATYYAVLPDSVTIFPLNPVTKGHLLVIPRTHVRDFSEDPHVTANTMRDAASIVQGMASAMNLIASNGREATQSVFHLHVHLVPRAENDGLALPWYSGKSKRRDVAEADELRKQRQG